MDCSTAQQLFDDLSRERLDPEIAMQVRQHLADCTDCRMLEQRAARLQRLLALKRYERPSPAYFQNFASEFHSRLLAEAQRVGWWERALGRIDDVLAVESVRVWRYRFASAIGVAAIMGMMWMGVRQTGNPDDAASQAAGTSPSFVITESQAMLPPSHFTPSSIVAPVPSSLHMMPADYQPATAGSVVMDPAQARADSAAPRYVLDHISVTPASYDVASFHF